MQLSDMLSGGDPRSLGRTAEVVDTVAADKSLLPDLMDCVKSTDEIIRMRASDALEKICRQKPAWFKPYVTVLLHQWPEIRQPSVQWHLAQILSEVSLTDDEQTRAVAIMKRNLKTMDDWIVTNLTLESLANFARKQALASDGFVAILKQHQKSRHKSVVSRVNKLLKEFDHV